MKPRERVKKTLEAGDFKELLTVLAAAVNWYETGEDYVRELSQAAWNKHSSAMKRLIKECRKYEFQCQEILRRAE